MSAPKKYSPEHLMNVVLAPIVSEKSTDIADAMCDMLVADTLRYSMRKKGSAGAGLEDGSEVNSSYGGDSGRSGNLMFKNKYL